jgi:ABC-type antimicrobial peptide transport system permease subunit
VNGDARTFASRLRSIAAEAEPSLGLGELQTADRAKDDNLRFYSFWFWLVVGVSSVALLLSLAGIYAVMSFTVARRTREIGVRVALGARPVRVVRTILRRPLIQAGSGIAAGWALTVALLGGASWGGFGGLPWIQLVGYGALMTAVCLLAAVVPARRALAVEPTEALREDG